MGLPPAVVIHGLAQARAALALGLPVTLLSAPGAGIYGGVGWWRAVIAAAVIEAGGLGPQVRDVLDCGDSPGRAMEALRGGQALLILRCGPGVWDDIAERAARQGALLLHARPPALDLADRGAARHLRGWLTPPDPLATGN